MWVLQVSAQKIKWNFEEVNAIEGNPGPQSVCPD